MDFAKTLDKLKANLKRQEALAQETREHIQAIEKLVTGGNQQELPTGEKPPRTR